MNRRAFLSRGVVVLATPGALMAAACGGETRLRSFTAVFDNWILSLHPVITQVNAEVGSKMSPRPVVALGSPTFGSKAADDWDVWVGMMPWVNAAFLADNGFIEPWDAYVAEERMDEIVPAVRAESTFNGHLYSWPFLLDVVVQGWNRELVERAGLDPREVPKSWDAYISHARTVVKSGAAPYGCTFDPHGFRSLVPIAHSLGSDLFTEDGLFDFTHPATVEALEVMRRMTELSHPDVLERSGVIAPISPDEAAFAAQTVAYYVKYQNAHVRLASAWVDPRRLQLAPLPPGNGPGGTTFWSIGLALSRFGTHKRAAAEYAQGLTGSERIWRRSMGSGRDAAGELPVSRTLPPWSPAGWAAAWVPAVRDAFRTASAIPPHPLGVRQFDIADEYWLQYLRQPTKSLRDGRAALEKALRAVRQTQAARNEQARRSGAA